MKTPPRTISPAFLHDLIQGRLKPILQVLQYDDTLSLGLRGSYVSIYYRGGELLKLIEQQEAYKPQFNFDYDVKDELKDRLQRHGAQHVLHESVCSEAGASALADVIWELKRLMDVHPKIASSHEREFQQLIVRENNHTRAAGETPYFITDIEYADNDARFDMLGVRWLASERKHGDRLLPVLFEVKYGGDALYGKAGLVEHLEDLYGRLKDKAFLQALREEIAGQFNQLNALKLLKFNLSGGIKSFTVSEEKPQVVIVLAGYNPRSGKLRKLLAELDRFAHLEEFELLFFHATFAGYAMHDCAMLELADFRTQVELLAAKS